MSLEMRPEPHKNDKYLKTFKVRPKVIWSHFLDFLKRQMFQTFGKLTLSSFIIFQHVEYWTFKT